MKATAGDKRRKDLGAIAAALLCALAAALAVAAGPAAAEEGDSAPLRKLSDGGLTFPEVNGPSAPEDYPLLLEPIGPEITVHQVGEKEVAAEYVEGGYPSWTLEAPEAHDADGATVPTTLKLTEGDIVVLSVHFRTGNPAAGGAPFVYPITEGKGWNGGPFTGVVESTPEPTATEPAAECVVPALDGVGLRAAKTRLRSHHCTIGKVRLAHGATAAKGKVVKQFRASGTELAPGAPVAVKLGRRPAR